MSDLYAVPCDKVAVGTRLIADDGFTCLDEGALRVVRQDAHGHLFIDCSCGKHYLDGQASGAGEHGLAYDHYIGVKFAEDKQ